MYELLTIWPGGEYVHFSTENKKEICEKYNRCREQEVPIRIRENGIILTMQTGTQYTTLTCAFRWRMQD